MTVKYTMSITIYIKKTSSVGQTQSRDEAKQMNLKKG